MRVYGPHVFAPCSCHFHDLDAVEVRYRRLTRAMRWAACLSGTEAACALRDYRHDWPGGEAVSHFGGPLKVIRAAIQTRNAVQTLQKLYPQMWAPYDTLPKKGATREISLSA